MWEDAEVEEKVATFLTEKEKKSALKVQLCLRQKVIGSKCHRSYFTMSSGGKMKPITVLIDNLRFVCPWSSGEPSSETESDYSQPSLINPAIPKNQKESYKETALKTTEKMTEKDMEIWESKPPKLTYGLLQTLFSVIDESSFWTSSDIVLPIQLITGLTEEKVRGIVQQPNNFKKKVNTALKKKPDLTESYPAFLLLPDTDRKVDSLFISKNCSKLGITLDTLNNQSNNDFFALTNGCILEIDEYCKKSHLSNTHFADIVNRLSLGKFEFDRCSINNNVEVLKKEGRKFQRLPLSNRSSTSISNNNEFSDQLFMPTTKKIKDPLQEAKKKKKKKKK